MKTETRGRKKGTTVQRTHWIERDVDIFLRTLEKPGAFLSATAKRSKAFREFKKKINEAQHGAN